MLVYTYVTQLYISHLQCKSQNLVPLEYKLDISIESNLVCNVYNLLKCWNDFRFIGTISRQKHSYKHNYTPRTTKLLGGYTGFTPSVRPSVRLSVRPSVRPSRMPCPLCIIYSYGWILFILGTNDHYHERVCRAPWPLTLTYIFKVIRPWLRKSCPLCSVYSSGWILSIFGTNDHYH